MTGSEAEKEDYPIGKLQVWQENPSRNVQESDSDQNRSLQVVASSAVGVSRVVCGLARRSRPPAPADPLSGQAPGPRQRCNAPRSRDPGAPAACATRDDDAAAGCCMRFSSMERIRRVIWMLSCAVMSNFGACEVHKVLPVRRGKRGAVRRLRRRSPRGSHAAGRPAEAGGEAGRWQARPSSDR